MPITPTVCAPLARQRRQFARRTPQGFPGVLMPKRTDIRSIMVIGAGPIVIGQACEFD
jgi:carbamoyl-phosphate synthase large subunit